MPGHVRVATDSMVENARIGAEYMANAPQGNEVAKVLGVLSTLILSLIARIDELKAIADKRSAPNGNTDASDAV